MAILALDLATKCGWAVGDLPADWLDLDSHQVKDAHTPTSGVWNLDPKKQPKVTRLLKLEESLHEARRRFGVTAVAYESSSSFHHKGKQAAFVAAALAGVLQTWCFKWGVECLERVPGDIKQHATGKRGASKEEMIAAASRIAGYAIDSDDEADAICLLSLVLSERAKK